MLVLQALRGSFDHIASDRYDGFNLLFGTSLDLKYRNNIDSTLSPVEPGVHGLSNHLLDTPWPQVDASLIDEELGFTVSDFTTKP